MQLIAKFCITTVLLLFFSGSCWAWSQTSGRSETVKTDLLQSGKFWPGTCSPYFRQPPSSIMSGYKHNWGPAPGTVIFDSYRHPAWPAYSCPYHSACPRTWHYEPDRPWYEEMQFNPAGRLVLLVEPVQAEVFINGHPLQQQKDLSHAAGLLQGEHLVQIQAEGYQSYQKTLQLRAGQRLQLNIRLQPVEKEQ